MTVGEKLYFVRSVGSNALNGLYEYSPGDAEPKQLVAHDRINSFMVDDNAIFYKYAASHPVYKTKLTGGAGKVITSGNTNNAFAGQDETYLYMPKDWGSGGPLVKVVK